MSRPSRQLRVVVRRATRTPRRGVVPLALLTLALFHPALPKPCPFCLPALHA
jgi:hypothetical protein